MTHFSFGDGFALNSQRLIFPSTSVSHDHSPTILPADAPGWRRLPFLLLAGGVCFVVIGRGRPQSIPAPDDSRVELTVQHEGATYKLVNGDLDRVASPDRLVFVEKIYDDDCLNRNYASQDGQVFRVDTDSGKRYPIRRCFGDGFENADPIKDLTGVERGWTSFTLQSSLTPSVSEYVQLRNRILRGEAKFTDNRVEPSSECVRTASTVYVDDVAISDKPIR